MRKKFVSKNKAFLSDSHARVYGVELERIKSREGKLTPKLIIEYATSSRNPMHKFFDWDDNEASKKWRHQQAINLTGMIGEIVVVEGKRTKQRSFFGVKGGRSGVSYVTLKEVAKSQPIRERLLSDVIRRLESVTDLMKMLKKM